MNKSSIGGDINEKMDKMFRGWDVDNRRQLCHAVPHETSVRSRRAGATRQVEKVEARLELHCSFY